MTAYPLHSFRTLLKDLATLTLNIAHRANPNAEIVITRAPRRSRPKPSSCSACRPTVPVDPTRRRAIVGLLTIPTASKFGLELNLERRIEPLPPLAAHVDDDLTLLIKPSTVGIALCPFPLCPLPPTAAL